jgi:hypothetical protein
VVDIVLVLGVPKTFLLGRNVLAHLAPLEIEQETIVIDTLVAESEVPILGNGIADKKLVLGVMDLALIEVFSLFPSSA